MAKGRPRASEKNGRLTREIWIREGLQILAEQGEAAVRIDVIAKKLNITRGSFYWHFEDRAAFLSAILEEWHRASTIVMQEDLERDGLAPVKRIELLLEAINVPHPMAPSGSIERALGQWASYNDEVAELLVAVHQERIRYGSSLFSEMGHKEPILMAEILYSYIVGRNQIAAHMPLDQHRAETTLELLGISTQSA